MQKNFQVFNRRKASFQDEPIMTYLFLAINIIVYIYMLIRFGTTENMRTLQHHHIRAGSAPTIYTTPQIWLSRIFSQFSHFPCPEFCTQSAQAAKNHPHPAALVRSPSCHLGASCCHWNLFISGHAMAACPVL